MIPESATSPFPADPPPLVCSAMSRSITDLDDNLLSEIAKSLLRCDRFDVPAIVGSGDDILQFSYMCRAFREALGPFLQEAHIRRTGRIWPMGADELASTRQAVAEDLSRELLRLFVDAMRQGIFCRPIQRLPSTISTTRQSIVGKLRSSAATGR